MSTPGVSGEFTAGLWMTVSELARQRGVDKSAVSRRVKRFVEQGLLTTRPGSQGSKLINLAEFDRVTGETTDAVRELNGTSAERKTALWPFKQQDLVLSKEQARRASYDADLKELELLEREGKLVLIERVEEAITHFAESVVRKIDQLPTCADESASAIARDGAHGAARVLEKVRDELLATIAAESRNALASLARIIT